MRSQLTLVALAVLLTLAGCKEEPGAGEVVRLTSAAELTQLEDELLARVELNRKRSCVRPVLRGQAAPGKAGEDIVAVVDGAEDTRVCLAKLSEHSERLHKALALPEGHRVEGWPARSGRALAPLVADAALDGLGLICAPAIARVRQAVGYGDGCSPFLPGLRGQGTYINLIRSGRLVAFLARGLMSKGESARAAQLMLDGLRFCQDAARGPTSLLETMVAVGASADLVAVLEALLNQPEPLGAELLDQIERELGLLVAGAAHPAVYLAGEMDSMALYSLLPGAKEPGWTPPGGWGEGGIPPNLEAAAMELDGLHELDGIVLAWIGMKEMWSEVLEGCKPADPPVRCHERLHELAERSAQVPVDDWGVLSTLLEVALTDDKRAALRRKIIDILKAVAAPPFERYVARHGVLMFQFQALRLHAMARRLAEEAGSCPTVDAFDQTPLKSLRSDPYSTKPIRVEQLGPNRLALWPPVPLGKQAGLDAPPGVFVVCPAAAK